MISLTQTHRIIGNGTLWKKEPSFTPAHPYKKQEKIYFCVLESLYFWIAYWKTADHFFRVTLPDVTYVCLLVSIRNLNNKGA
jgi:hypothetical protein